MLIRGKESYCVSRLHLKGKVMREAGAEYHHLFYEQFAKCKTGLCFCIIFIRKSSDY